MSNITENLGALKVLRDDIREAIEEKGAILPVGSHMNLYPEAILSIETAVEPPKYYVLKDTDPDYIPDEFGVGHRYVGPETHIIVHPSIADINILFVKSAVESVILIGTGYTSAIAMFSDLTSETLDLSNFTTVTEMDTLVEYSGMFSNTKNLISVTGTDHTFISRNATDLGYMFQGSNIAIFDGMERWDVSNVSIFKYMFADGGAKMLMTPGVDQTPIQHWTLPSATNLSYMFRANELFNFPLPDITRYSSIKYDARSMFADCLLHFEEIPRSFFMRAKDLSYFFKDSRFTVPEIILSFETNGTDIVTIGMFDNISREDDGVIETIRVDGYPLDGVATEMFSNLHVEVIDISFEEGPSRPQGSFGDMFINITCDLLVFRKDFITNLVPGDIGFDMMFNNIVVRQVIIDGGPSNREAFMNETNILEYVSSSDVISI